MPGALQHENLVNLFLSSKQTLCEKNEYFVLDWFLELPNTLSASVDCILQSEFQDN